MSRSRKPQPQTLPLVTGALAALSLAVFLFEVTRPSARAAAAFLEAWGVVPREFALRRDLPPSIPLPFWTTGLTALFLHAGWAHLAADLVFLGLFGSALERLVGHARLLAFYLLCGLGAAAACVALSPQSTTPALSASGAVSGLLGGYLMILPSQRLPLTTALRSGARLTVPPQLLLGVWMAIQVLSAFILLGPTLPGSFLAGHLGGFAAGSVFIHAFAAGRRPSPGMPTHSLRF